MDISYPSESTMVIRGEMKTIEHYTEIKKAVGELLREGVSDITIEIKDSMTITSSIIGLFTKSIHGDNLKINLLVHNESLMALLEDLNLVSIFNAKKA